MAAAVERLLVVAYIGVASVVAEQLLQESTLRLLAEEGSDSLRYKPFVPLVQRLDSVTAIQAIDLALAFSVSTVASAVLASSTQVGSTCFHSCSD